MCAKTFWIWKMVFFTLFFTIATYNPTRCLFYTLCFIYERNLLFYFCLSFHSVHHVIIWKVLTSIIILIYVSYVFHCKSKHGALVSKKLNRNDLLPVFPIVINIDIDSSSNRLIFFVELWCPNSKVLPSLEKKTNRNTATKVTFDCWAILQSPWFDEQGLRLRGSQRIIEKWCS